MYIAHNFLDSWHFHDGAASLYSRVQHLNRKKKKTCPDEEEEFKNEKRNIDAYIPFERSAIFIPWGKNL